MTFRRLVRSSVQCSTWEPVQVFMRSWLHHSRFQIFNQCQRDTIMILWIEVNTSMISSNHLWHVALPFSSNSWQFFLKLFAGSSDGKRASILLAWSRSLVPQVHEAELRMLAFFVFLGYYWGKALPLKSSKDEFDEINSGVLPFCVLCRRLLAWWMSLRCRM